MGELHVPIQPGTEFSSPSVSFWWYIGAQSSRRRGRRFRVEQYGLYWRDWWLAGHRWMRRKTQDHSEID
jgi:hypothetical protein